PWHTCVVSGKPGHQRAVPTPQTDANIAVEQAVAVAVLGDQQQTAVEVAACGSADRATAYTGQHLLDTRIQATRPLWSLSHRGEDAQLVRADERFGGVIHFGQ